MLVININQKWPASRHKLYNFLLIVINPQVLPLKLPEVLKELRIMGRIMLKQFYSVQFSMKHWNQVLTLTATLRVFMVISLLFLYL